MTVVLVLHQADFLPWFVPLFDSLQKQKYRVVVAIDMRPHSKPHQRIVDKLPEVKKVLPAPYLFFESNEQLAAALHNEKPLAVITVEGLPLRSNPELFQNRSYKIYSLIHSVDNITAQKGAWQVIDAVITPYLNYGAYLGWTNQIQTIPLGNPKYDYCDKLDPEEIRHKYNLPDRYVLMFAPNHDLLSPLRLWRVIRYFQKQGCFVVLKGKSPKCHRPLYHFLANRYFLTEHSLYPFVVHELLAGSYGAIGFDTTGVEEALMLKQPFINFAIKPYRSNKNFKQFEFMWRSPFCLDIPFQNTDWRKVLAEYPRLVDHFNKHFDYEAIQKKTYSIPGGAADRIVDFITKDGEPQSN